MGFSLKKLVKKVGNAAGAVAKPVTKATRFVVAPVAIGVTGVAKVATAGLAATGVKPFKKLDAFVGQELKAEIKMVAIHAAGGATVGGAIAGKPQIGAVVGQLVGKAGDAVVNEMEKKGQTLAAADQAQQAQAAGTATVTQLATTGGTGPAESFPAWLIRNVKALVAGKAQP